MFRITFSKSLAEHVAGENYKLGKPLKNGEKSRSGLYAVVAKKRDRILRVSLIKELAELMDDGESRYLAECWVTD